MIQREEGEKANKIKSLTKIILESIEEIGIAPFCLCGGDVKRGNPSPLLGPVGVSWNNSPSVPDGVVSDRIGASYACAKKVMPDAPPCDSTINQK